jgi:beta-phosphoglucomutase-like phosphatase (HAD superfamily)
MDKTASWIKRECRLAKKRPTFYVDIDETILHTDPWFTSRPVREFLLENNVAARSRMLNMGPKEFQKLVCKEGDVAFEFHKRVFISRLRPGAREFLARLRENGRVIALTHALVNFQKTALEAHGLTGEFEGIYGREDMGAAPKSKNSILIDDAGSGAAGLAMKFHAMGVLREMSPEELSRPSQELSDAAKRHLARIPAFEGDPADSFLETAADKILSKVNRK